MNLMNFRGRGLEKSPNIRKEKSLSVVETFLRNILMLLVMFVFPVQLMSSPMTISASGNPSVTGSGVGQVGIWTNAGTIDGEAIDLKATITAHNGSPVIFETVGDDPSVLINGATGTDLVTVHWEVFKSGTNQTVFAFGNPTFSVADIDGIGGNPYTREEVTPNLNKLTGFVLETPTNLVSEVVNGVLKVSGTQNQNSETTSMVSFKWNNVASWDITYKMHLNQSGYGARFVHDGDGDFVFVNPQSTEFLSLDLDNDDSTTSGKDYLSNYMLGDSAIGLADTDTLITQHVALGTDLGSATITLTNAQLGDVLTVGTLPAGLSSSIDTSIIGKITVKITGTASISDYETALQAIKFANSNKTSSVVDRVFETFVTNGMYGTSTEVSITTIVVDVDIDNDQIADKVDLDDDNDGILDTVEGTLDSDNDTIPNYLDLDSDNDGIPDNVEAQLTASYIAPSNTDANSDGIDDNYAGGLTPINTDGTDNPDYLDTDSDNDTINDTIEAGYTEATTTTDTDADGILDEYDDVTGRDVNDDLDVGATTLPDNDKGVADNEADVDFRDLDVDNIAPVAVDDNATTSEETLVSIDVLNNDSDADGGTLIIKAGSVTTPLHGTALINNGKIDYTPVQDFAGTDSFKYTVNDGTSDGNEVTVTVTVININDAPVAVLDTTSTNEEVSVSIPVLANDIDVDGDRILIKAGSVTVPHNGVAVINGTNIDYTPATNFEGTDSFKYTVNDGTVDGNEVTVTVTVNAVNDVPVGVSDTISTNEDTLVSIPVLANDTDVDGDTLLIKVGSVTTPSNGTAVINGTNIDYTPAPNFEGTDSFKYTLNDGTIDGNEVTVTVIVNAVNDAPVGVADSVTINEDTKVSISILVNDTDIENDTLSITNITNPTHGTIIVNGTDIEYTPNLNYVGVDTFTYTPNDGTVDGTVVTVTITVLEDTDGDGVINTLDLDDDNDGIPDSIEENGNVARDTDGDGIIDSLDLDSDNDGILDLVESGQDTSVVDTNNDGVLDSTTDADNDGLLDTADIDDSDINSLGTVIPIDTDSDGIRDFQDIDSDNDGLSDLVEGIIDTSNDTDNDGMIDGTVDANGIPTLASSVTRPTDTDNDNVPNYRDLDSDNDGLTDISESNGTDVDGNGLIDRNGILTDPSSFPVDGNGTINVLVPSNPKLPSILDSNSDGVLDDNNDTDGDGIPNVTDEEDNTYGTSPLVDTDGDGISNEYDLDDDNDGITDLVEFDGNPIRDTDSDGIIDSLDLDSDNDGLLDLLESGQDVSSVDRDGNGVLDSIIDADNDGLIDVVDVNANDATSIGNIVPIDTDRDARPNFQDVDADNDGIADMIEAGIPSSNDANNDGMIDGAIDENGIPTAVTIVLNPVDTDNDGIEDYKDLDADNDGLTDADEAGTVDTDGNGLVDNNGILTNPSTFPVDANGTVNVVIPSNTRLAGVLDTNDDGVIDDATDSDGDGIPDVIDQTDNDFATQPAKDTDNDGIADDYDLDDDNDGISDLIEEDGDSNRDTDSDGIVDSLDLDSDNDGILDLVESGQDISTIDTNNDGVLDSIIDVDNDGLMDVVDADDEDINSLGTVRPIDTDSDEIRDFQDLDSDNDGLSDLVEGITDASNDSDNDGMIDGRVDANGIPTLVSSVTIPTDTDNDNIPNYRDLDSDNDGLTDIAESNGTDVDGNGLIDTNGTLIDPTTFPVDISGTINVIIPSNLYLPGVLDANSDGVIDDNNDTDGDGIPNVADEKDNSYGTSPMIDTDGDGISNEYDLDDDNDGILDRVEESTSGNGLDTDGDGIPDSRDLDSDNDGILDLLESGQDTLVVDTNNDGVLDSTVDADNDGVMDIVDADANDSISEGLVVPSDTDRDGQPNFQDVDSDNDGVADLIEVGISISNDTDNDGMIDNPAVDVNGIPTVIGIVSVLPDTDSDGLANYLDLDSDNDGLTDTQEANTTDENKDGLVDVMGVLTNPTTLPTDNNGTFNILVVNNVNLPGVLDTNHDGVIDDNTDSDNDGIPNSVDGIDNNFITQPLADTDGDMIPDIYDLDDDNDGISDVVENDGNETRDTDGDGIIDSRDLDSDNDGILDIIEFGGIDANHDGLVDEDIDVDNDGLVDTYDSNISDPISTGILIAIDTDADGIPNHRDLDSDGDGIPDNVEAQTTTGYIEPNGATNANGRDTAYVDGLVPINHDGTDAVDYLDTDSDNDGILDKDENGLTLTGIVGVNGLDNGVESTDDYTDVNGNVNTPAIDLKNQTGDSSEVAYREVRIIASNDVGLSVNGSVGGETIASITANDTLNGRTVQLGTNVKITSSSGNRLVFDNGSVRVLEGTEAGTYSGSYTICENANPTNCDNGSITVEVTSAPINLIDDDLSTRAINSITGGVIQGVSVLDNDKLNGLSIKTSDISLSLVASETTVDGMTISSNGILTVPKNTVAGKHTVVYKVCELLNPNNCDTATVSIVVSTASLIGIDDENLMVDGRNGGRVIKNITANDTLNGVPVVLGVDVEITSVTKETPLIVNVKTGEVKVPTGIKQGTYHEKYTLCEILNPTNCVEQNIDINILDTTGPEIIITETKYLSDGKLEVHGTTEPFATVNIVFPTGEELIVTADASGNYVAISTEEQPLKGNVSAIATDANENSTPTAVLGHYAEEIGDDTDKDGIPDSIDLDDDNDGILDTVEENGNTDLDTDGDGVPDRLDLDSDNDGISDLLESGQEPSEVDTDGNGILDSTTDVDKDGLMDTADSDDTDETSTGIVTPIDTDEDTICDFQDVDSDNDSLSDMVEAGVSAENDADSDGMIDNPEVDTDGVPTIIDSVITPVNTDGDSVPDYRDLDSDNDGLNDVDEVDGLDENRDGIADTEELVDGTSIPDTNGDNIPNVLEVNNPDLPVVVDANRDGIIDDSTDTDNDGIPDVTDEQDTLFGTGIVIDSDGDGIADIYDIDDDNDGIPDTVEAKDNENRDTDGDGIIDSLDLDSDNDGILDIIEAGGVDSDNDGRVDDLTDSDKDGLVDIVDVAPTTSNSPVDEASGRLVTFLLVPDTDGDSKNDFQDVDSDNDGLSDLVEAGTSVSNDEDNNGMIDGEVDIDGIPILTTPIANPLDSDNDNIADYRELDSDNDGKNDIIEAGEVDKDNNGLIDEVDTLIEVNNLLDVDGDGTPDYREFNAKLLADIVSDIELGQPAIVSVLDNDELSGFDIETLQIVGTQNPRESFIVKGEGIWSINSNNEIIFTPEDGFKQDPTPIKYSLINNNGVKVTATVIVNYKALVREDRRVGDLSEPVTVEVLANDNGGFYVSSVQIELPEGFMETNPNAKLSEDKKTLVVPAQGTWRVNKDGTITYRAESVSNIIDPTPISYSVVDKSSGKRLKTDAMIVLKQSVVAGVIKTIDCEPYRESSIPVFNNIGLGILILIITIFGLYYFSREENN